MQKDNICPVPANPPATRKPLSTHFTSWATHRVLACIYLCSLLKRRLPRFAYLIETKDASSTNTSTQPSTCILRSLAASSPETCPAFAQLPGLQRPHLPRKRTVPSTRVLPTNTARAIRVPLLADFPASMLLPVSASIGRDVELRPGESRRVWFVGQSQESLRCWHPKVLSRSCTNGQL